jgi:hypothetical protein
LLLSRNSPFFALSLVSSMLTVLAQKSGGGLVSFELIPLSTRLLVASHALIMYLWKMILPLDLIPFYPYPRNVSLLSSKYLLAVVLVIGITLTCMLFAKKRKLLLTVWGYYIVALLPVIGIVEAGGQAMADRYTYLPSLGPFFITGLAAAWVYEKVSTLEKWGPFLKLFGIVAVTVIVVFMSYLTFEQIGIWNNSIRFWSYAIDRERGVPLLFYKRGGAFLKKGRFDEAIADFDKELALYPGDYRLYASRGMAFAQKGRTDMAIADFSRAAELNPSCYEAYNDRGVSYLITGQYDSALRDFNKAIELNRNYALPYLNRGRLLLERGNRTLSMADFQKACELGNKGGCDALETLQQAAAKPGR